MSTTTASANNTDDAQDDDGGRMQEEQQQHSCEIEITFPTSLQAQQAIQVLQVDCEPTNRVTKSFRLGGVDNGGGDGTSSATTMIV